MLVRTLLCIANFLWACNAARNVVKTQVAVLGGGMAGIIAARTLDEQGISDFVIVEARTELGGRMQDIALGNGVHVELGPNWIQGLGEEAHQNPIYTLALENDLLNVYSDFNNLTTFDDKGSVDMENALDVFNNAWTSYLAAAGSRASQQLPDFTARTGFSISRYKPRTYMDDAAEYYTFDFEFSQTPDESSFIASAMNHNFTYKGFSNENNLVVDQRGFKTIVQSEAAMFLDVDDPRLFLNHTVLSIKYSTNGVIIETANGVTIEAEHAICTFSVGVLQNDDVKFLPPLPSWKREAIEGMHMTTYTKIFLRFNTTFWSPTQFQLYADPSTRGYYPVWQSLDFPGFYPGSHVLFVTVTGHESVRIERQSDAETQSEVMTVLRSMYGPDIPEPEEMRFKRWHEDPLFRGSYSNWGPSYPPQMLDNLRSVVEGRLWFASEATSGQYYGFLQGAYFEGMDAAMEVAECLCGECSTSVSYYYQVVEAQGKTFLEEIINVSRNPESFL